MRWNEAVRDLILNRIDGREKNFSRKAFLRKRRHYRIREKSYNFEGQTQRSGPRDKVRISAEHKDYYSLITAGYGRRDRSSSAVNERRERFLASWRGSMEGPCISS